MSEKEIIEGNKLIYAYDGESFIDIGYHKDWDMLMPVVLKILKEENGVMWLAPQFAERTDRWRFQMLAPDVVKYNSEETEPIIAVWQAVVEYLKTK